MIILFSIIGIAFFIYSLVCCRKRKIIYTINKPEFIILDDRYFDLQLKASIVSSIVIFSGGSISVLFKLPSFTLMVTVLIFWGINYFFKFIVVKKKYAQNK